MRIGITVGAGLLALAGLRAQCPQVPRLLFSDRYEANANSFYLSWGYLAGVGDLDGRAGPDVVFANTLIMGQGLQVFLNNGSGILGRTWAPAPQLDVGGMALLDIDRDGDLDVVVVRPSSVPPLFFLNDGRGGFTLDPIGTHLADSLDAKSVCAGDFDGDGWTDLFIGMQDPGQCRVYLNDRTGRFVDATLTHLPWAVQGCAQHVVAADLDRDGDQDIVIAMGGVCGPKQANVVLWNDGQGHFTPLVLAGVRRWSVYVAVGDLDGDGLPDLFMGNFNDPPELWLNRGSTFIDASANVPSGTLSVYAAAIMDVDRDGWRDIVVAALPSSGIPRLEAYRSQAGTSFVYDPTLIWPPNLLAYFLHSADMDGDGDEDLVVAGHTTDLTRGLKIFVHSHRHVLPVGAPTLGTTWVVEFHGQVGQIVFPAFAAGPGHLDLGSLGTLGLDPAGLAVLPPIVFTACRAALPLVVPNLPSLRGRPIYTQACILDVANPNDTRLTNWIVDLIQ